jgi:hypothetical protein
MPAKVRSSTLEVVNDATAYGVSIVSAQVVQGEVYWKCIKVHHLAPEENQGNHHVYIDVLDENDQRVYGTQISIKWPTGSGIGTIDKPATEAGTNFPLWKNQVVEIKVIGRPSDSVAGLHTGHPNEGSGNTLYHHSFYVVFKRTTYDAGDQTSSGTVKGTVKNGAGKTIALQQAGQQVAETKTGDDGTYSFTQLAAGTYCVSVVGTGVTSGDISVDGKSAVTVDLEVPVTGPSTQTFAVYVLFGSINVVGTRTNFVLAQDYILRTGVACGFNVDEALLAKRVVIVGDTTGVSQADEDKLTQAGITVTRISGDSYAVEAALAKLT